MRVDRLRRPGGSRSARAAASARRRPCCRRSRAACRPATRRPLTASGREGREVRVEERVAAVGLQPQPVAADRQRADAVRACRRRPRAPGCRRRRRRRCPGARRSARAARRSRRRTRGVAVDREDEAPAREPLRRGDLGLPGWRGVGAGSGRVGARASASASRLGVGAGRRGGRVGAVDRSAATSAIDDRRARREAGDGAREPHAQAGAVAVDGHARAAGRRSCARRAPSPRALAVDHEAVDRARVS